MDRRFGSLPGAPRAGRREWARSVAAISNDVSRHLHRRAKQEHIAIIAKRLIGGDAVEPIETNRITLHDARCVAPN